MKSLVQFICDSLESQSTSRGVLTEAANTTAIVNKIKKEFQKEFGNKVTIGSGRANYQQLYDVYIYDMDINTLKKVNDILKKHITIWKGFTDEEMQKKLDDKKEFFDKYKDDKSVSIDRYPVEFFRFTSRDLKKMLNEAMVTEAGIAGKLETPFDKLCSFNKVDPKKKTWVMVRKPKDKSIKVFTFEDEVKLEKFIDSLRDGKNELGYLQMMSNDEDWIKRMTHLPSFKSYKKIFEECGETEHKIVKDAAGNWRIKGTPGKGTNTDKEGLWAAKYKTEEDAKKALAAYHIHESKNTFTLSDSERDALKEFLGVVTGNLGEESEIKKYEGLFKSLEDGEFDKLSDIYDFIEDDRTYPKVTYKNFQQDERQLVKKCFDWAEENGLIDNNYDLMDALEKIS